MVNSYDHCPVQNALTDRDEQPTPRGHKSLPLGTAGTYVQTYGTDFDICLSRLSARPTVTLVNPKK